MSTETSAAASAPSHSENALHRGLGVSSIVAMVAAGAAPLAVVALTTPIIIALSGSVAAPLLFIVAGIVLLLFSVGFTSMSRHVRNSGAFYSYIQAGLGRVVGIGAAVLALVSYFLLQVGLYTYVGVAVTGAISRFSGVETPWWLWTLVSFLIISALGYRDIELSSKILLVALVAEAGVVLILDASIFFRGGAEGLSAAPLNAADLLAGTPSIGLMFAFFCFIGFEATAVFRNEARDPDRTIPRATYIAVGMIAALYAVSAFALVIGVGPSRALDVAANDTANMTPDLFMQYTGVVVHDITNVLLVTSTFACALTFHNVLTRYQYTLGSLKVLSPRLAEVHPRFRAPSFSSIVVTIITGILVLAMTITGLDPINEIYTWFSGAATLGLLTLMTLTSIAVVVFFRRHDDRRITRTVIAPIIAALALATVVIIALANIELLIPDSVATGILLTLLVLAFIAGTILAVRMRRAKPQAYARLHDQES
ncbi:APC family permease [Microbacterium esteraromaticum]|uniref:APC family permease n=1 Tax=Microbacterium esteraromaticum TaxID=57043 RepID=UPI0030A18A72